MLLLISAVEFNVLLGLLLKMFTVGSAKHAKGYCAMYDICGEREDGKVLNCPYGTPAVTVDVAYIHTFMIL